MFLKNKKNRFPKKEELAGGFSVSDDLCGFEDLNEVEKVKPTLISEILEWLEIIVTAIIVVVLVFSLIFRISTINGDSMLNTLIGQNSSGSVGDKVIITNLFYEPKQGDIVVVSRNADNSVESGLLSKEPIIKRVIATGGQTVNIDFKTGTVYVDGVELEEDYISSPTTNSYDVEFPVFVPEGYIFVLGDNRAVSLDSRSSKIGQNGLIDERYILGHAVYRIFPFDRMGGLNHE